VRGGRTRGSARFPDLIQLALKPLVPVAQFLLTPAGLAVAIVVILAAALPWLSIVDVLNAGRRAVIEASGVACYLLAFDALLLALIPTSFVGLGRSRRFWLLVSGAQALGLFAWGVLGLWRPHLRLAGVDLHAFSAGGRVGASLTSGILPVMIWVGALAGGYALLHPAGARWLVRQVPPLLRGLWRLRLPARTWTLLQALVARGGAPLPAVELAGGGTLSAVALEDEPRIGTIGQGAADAFRRSGEVERKKRAATAATPEVKHEPSQPEAPAAPADPRGWQLPGPQLLVASPPSQLSVADNEARARTIVETLSSFGVDAKVVQINQGPTVTQFGVEPGWEVKRRSEPERDSSGKVVFDKDGRPKLRVEEVSRTRVRVNQITKLQNDLALALAAPSIRIEAPVPGKPVVGIEVPNTSAAVVSLRSVVESPQFSRAGAKSKLALALGMGVSGEPIVADLARMPHVLIAGSTGSGKSVCINAIIACILMHATPEEVRFVLIDPKRVEMAQFELIPHLALSKIITDMEDVPGTLQGVIIEMEARYKKFEQLKVRNLEAYNRHPKVAGKLPQWVVVIDELADLMMAVPYEVERQICRLAQLARATGIHLVVATQRPSVDVITGLIKANFPTRIAFAVSSQVDSRTILDTGGAERLLGRGDMLFVDREDGKPRRLQGVYVSDQEIERLVDFWGAERWEHLRPQTFDHLVEEAKAEQAAAEAPEEDELLEKARALALEHTRISTSMLQRRLRIGYPRAARLMDALEEEGLLGEADKGGSREVLGSDEDSIFGDL
jgi:S-DNA-T family DNA segregation ATPase FtsK/SpoIIIE